MQQSLIIEVEEKPYSTSIYGMDVKTLEAFRNS